MPKSCNKDGCNNPRWGGGYCRNHGYLRTDKKLKGLSNVRKPTGERDMFDEIFSERPHVSQLSGKPIGHFKGTDFYPNLFAHVLPKGQYKHYRLNKQNIILLTPYEHILLDQGSEENRAKYGEENDCDWSWIYELKVKLREEYRSKFGN